MKVCPICNAKAFDDAEVCFGCMHRFGESPERALPVLEPAEGAHVGSVRDGGLPAFQITLTPPAVSKEPGPWTCSVELVKGAR